MPEGDTIWRTAQSLRRWVGGREVTAARTTVPGLAVERLLGHRAEAVEARGKHLLVRFSGGLTLHTHMRMTGSWHVYPAGRPWRRPEQQARVVLEAGERVAVCFNAPVVELLASREELAHPGLAGLGPDVLVEPLDLAEVGRRAATRPPELAVAELLLDQRVVSGIGNIYRCESLFVGRAHPWTPWPTAPWPDLVSTAADLMRANLVAGVGFARDLGAGPDRPWVYRRQGRPCRRCGTLIAVARLGAQARTVYWCPTCQPPDPSFTMVG